MSVLHRGEQFPHREIIVKYFTKTYWRDMQRLLDGPDEIIQQDMKYRNARYQKQLRGVLPLLPKATRSILRDESFNGAYVSFIQMVQHSVAQAARAASTRFTVRGRKHNMDLLISLIYPESRGPGIAYDIAYKDVKSYRIDYPSSDPINFAWRHGLDSWGFDELSRSGQWLTHDILFESGGEMTVTFKTMSIRKRRLRHHSGRFGSNHIRALGSGVDR